MRRVVAGLAVAAALVDGGGAVANTVVELFTSQGCSSCPPADALLGELAARDGIVALEFHVDYWDDLADGRSGRWRDPLASPLNTERQRAYNRNILGHASVYTPQIVVGGRTETVGSRRHDVEAAIRAQAAASGPRSRVSVQAEIDGRLTIDVDGPAVPSTAVWLVRFEERRTTQVSGGENRGRTLVNHHVVTGMQRLGTWYGGPSRFVVADTRPGAGEGCAVLIQDDRQGPIAGAARCPRR